jgi:hypothetical protein
MQQVHALSEKNFQRLLARQREPKNKSPAKPGFDEYLFLPVHFASLAIACVRRDTLRLALFL